MLTQHSLNIFEKAHFVEKLKNLQKSYLPKTIHSTIQFPVIAINNIAPKTMPHAAFCSHGNSNRLFDAGKRHSEMNSLKMNKEKNKVMNALQTTRKKFARI